MRRPLVAFDRGSLEVFAEIERRGGRAQGRQEGEIMLCRRFVLLATPAARGSCSRSSGAVANGW